MEGTRNVGRRWPGERWRAVWERLVPLREHVRRRVTVDTRSLAALRIALGSILLLDLVHRAGHLRLFYTDQGVYPLAAYEAGTAYPSLHALSGDPLYVWALFLVAGLFALAFAVGYRTRLVGVVSLVLLTSLHARNPMILNGGDRLLQIILAVSLLTPLGERWSVDALRRGSARATVASAGTAALLVQPVVVFTSNALLKHRGDRWYAGEGLQVALANDVMTVYLGDHLVAYPAALEVLNWLWIVLLSGSGLFLLLSAGRWRAVAVFLYLGAFAGMAATMAVGWFPLVLAASVLPFLTTPFWEAAARRLPIRPGTGWTPPGPVAGPPVERRLLAAVERRWAPAAAALRTGARVALALLAVVALLWMLLFSAADVAGVDPGAEVGVDVPNQQSWGLYAPDPTESYSWFAVEALLEDGSTVDALDGGELRTERPAEAAATYETFRHRKFMESVRGIGDDGTVADSYAAWACRRAVERHDQRVIRVTVYRFYQPSPIDGEFEEPDRRTVVQRVCEDRPSSGS